MKKTVTYDPALIETAVRRRVDAASEQDAPWIRTYRAEMDELYDVSETDRPAGFAALDRRYFNRIGIPAVVDECLEERAHELSSATSVTLIAARARSEEGVDVTREGRLVLRYGAAAFDSTDTFRENLRSELVQAADCLDPSFGHSPELLDGLLPSEKERICAALSSLWAQSAERRLQTGQMDSRPTFPEMFEFCRSCLGSEIVAAGVCALCRFPSEDVVLLSALSPNGRDALKTEFPELRDDARICARCAERSGAVEYDSAKQGANS